MWFSLLAGLQLGLAVRVGLRFLRSAGGVRIKAAKTVRSDRVTVIVPVLNERSRLEACLDALMSQYPAVAEILVVDGGSSDGSQAIVESYRLRDRRLRLIDASPVPFDWTGKAWGLYMGLKNSDPTSQWILCIDADVCCSPLLVGSLLAHAELTGVSTFSVATRQHVSDRVDALLHPSLLTTLIYRFGIPGKATRNLNQVQANGQCFISPRNVLLKTDAFRAAQRSLCEDITIARRLAECGEAVGFYETDGLVDVRMYEGYNETWRNWPRSLPTRDQYFSWRHGVGFLEVLAVQSLPLPLLPIVFAMGASGWIVGVNLTLSLSRLGVLLGTARVYERKPWTYWLSPLVDLPVAVRLITSALRRYQVWRGRLYVREAGGTFKALERSNRVTR